MSEIPLHISNPHDAFLTAMKMHDLTDYNEATPEHKLVTSIDFFNSGFRYLARSCTNNNLKKQARIANLVFEQNAISFGFTGAIDLAADINNITLVSGGPSIVNVGFPKDIRNGLETRILMMNEFVTLAQTNPLDALAHVVFALSCVRDFGSHRRWIDWQNFLPRAQAAASELIIDFFPGDEYWRLSTDVINMVDAFPNGLKSLDPSMTYTKPSGLPLYGDLI